MNMDEVNVHEYMNICYTVFPSLISPCFPCTFTANEPYLSLILVECVVDVGDLMKIKATGRTEIVSSSYADNQRLRTPNVYDRVYTSIQRLKIADTANFLLSWCLRFAEFAVWKNSKGFATQAQSGKGCLLKYKPSASAISFVLDNKAIGSNSAAASTSFESH